MNADEYQRLTRSTAQFPFIGGFPEIYLALGLAGETGEVVELVKKHHRDGPRHDYPSSMAKELGDVLWYVAQLCDAHGLSLSEVMAINIEKLADRLKRNKIGGSGDDR